MKTIFSVGLLLSSFASIEAIAEHANEIAITYSGADRYQAPPAIRPPAPRPPSRRSRDIDIDVNVNIGPNGAYGSVSTSNGGYGSFSGNRYGGSGSYSGPRGHVSYGWQRPSGSYASTGYAYPPYGYSYSSGSPYYSTYSPNSPSSYNNPANCAYPSFSTGSTTYVYRSTPGYNTYGYGGYGYGSGYGSYGGSYSYSRSPGSFQFSGTGPYGRSLNIRAVRGSTY